MYTNVHVCIRMYMYVYECTCMYTNVHVCIRMYMYVYECTCMYTNVHVCIRMYMYVHTNVHVCIRMYMYVHTNVHVQCMNVHACIRMYGGGHECTCTVCVAAPGGGGGCVGCERTPLNISESVGKIRVLSDFSQVYKGRKYLIFNGTTRSLRCKKHVYTFIYE